MDFFDTLIGAQPAGALDNQDSGSNCELRDPGAVADKVAVPMRDANEVCCHRIGRGFSSRVAGEKGVNKDVITAGLEVEHGVPVPGNIKAQGLSPIRLTNCQNHMR